MTDTPTALPPEPDDRTAASLVERAARIPTARVLTWDWREQIDIDQLRAALHVVTRGEVHVYNVDTGSDQYAIVLSNRPLTPAAVVDAYRIDAELAAPVTPGGTMTQPTDTCRRCRRPFDPTDRSANGAARYLDKPFCRGCVDRCHESTDAFHECQVCVDPAKGTRRRRLSTVEEAS